MTHFKYTFIFPEVKYPFNDLSRTKKTTLLATHNSLIKPISLKTPFAFYSACSINNHIIRFFKCFTNQQQM